MRPHEPLAHPHSGTPKFWLRCFYMSSDPIAVALTQVHSLVWQNLRPTNDAATVAQVRELIHSPSVRSTLERSSDSLPAFALREVVRVLTDQSQTHAKIIFQIRNILDQPHLNDALGLGQNRWITFRHRPRNL